MRSRLRCIVLLGSVLLLGTKTPMFAQRQSGPSCPAGTTYDKERDYCWRPLPVSIYATQPERKPQLPDKDYSSGSTGAPKITGNGNGSAETFTSDYAASGAFTQEVLAGQGQLGYSIRERFPANRDSVFRSKLSGVNGHHYWSLTSLGRSAKPPEQIMRVIMQDPDKVFTAFAAHGEHGQRVTMGNVYHLTNDFGDNPVQVTNTTPYYFTLTTLPGHMLQGSATHGIFRDSTGELWMFQEGVGVPGEPITKRYITAQIAHLIWRDMAEIVRYRIVEP